MCIYTYIYILHVYQTYIHISYISYISYICNICFFMHIKFVHKIHFIHSNAVYIMRYTHHFQWQNQKRWIASVHLNADFLHLLSAVKPLWITCQAKGFRWRKNWFEENASPPCKTSTSSFETEKVPAEMSKAQADQWHCPPPWTPTAPKSWWPSLTLKVFQARNAGLMNCLVGTWTNGLSHGQRSTPTVAYVCWETKQSVWKPHQTLYIIIWYVSKKTLTSHHHMILFVCCSKNINPQVPHTTAS